MHETPPEKTFWGWKALIIACILSVIFLGIFYLAMENDPDYMPSQQNKEHSQQQHAFKNAPAMSEEALAKAEADKLARNQADSEATAEAHGMTAEEHANMGQHGHGH